jgi:hypothetical protein
VLIPFEKPQLLVALHMQRCIKPIPQPSPTRWVFVRMDLWPVGPQFDKPPSLLVVANLPAQGVNVLPDFKTMRYTGNINTNEKVSI